MFDRLVSWLDLHAVFGHRVGDEFKELFAPLPPRIPHHGPISEIT